MPSPAAPNLTTKNRKKNPKTSLKRQKKLRSEEHTSELQSHVNLVCRLLLEKKNKENSNEHHCLPCRHGHGRQRLPTTCRCCRSKRIYHSRDHPDLRMYNPRGYGRPNCPHLH